MPTLQFGDLPWDITSDEFDGLAVIRKYVDLHEQYADLVLAAMDNSIANGFPVNPPLWWIDPTNPDLYEVSDEYLLGEWVLVAPIIEEGSTSRDIVFPTGLWQDANTGDVYEGPVTIRDYHAPIDLLPYFFKVD